VNNSFQAEKSLRTKTRSLEEEIFRSRRMQVWYTTIKYVACVSNSPYLKHLLKFIRKTSPVSNENWRSRKRWIYTAQRMKYFLRRSRNTRLD
jgi:hypothetical protein